MTELPRFLVADMYHGNPVDFGKLAGANYNGIQCRRHHSQDLPGAGAADPEYPKRRPLAIAAGFLWGAYASGQYRRRRSGRRSLNSENVGAGSLTALFSFDFEDNTHSEMTLAQGVEFLDRTG